MVTDSLPLDPEDGFEVDPADTRRRSLTMTLRQLYQTVKSGQQVTFSVFDDDPVTGYLAGIDDEHYFVLEPVHGKNEFHKKIIRKACCPVFKLHSGTSYRHEPEELRDIMDPIIVPFKSWVLMQFYSRTRSAERDVA